MAKPIPAKTLNGWIEAWHKSLPAEIREQIEREMEIKTYDGNNRTDDLMARRAKRKVEKIVESTSKAFRQAADEYGTLSADEILAIGVNLLMKLTVAPLEKLAADPAQMRKEVAKMMMAMIEQGGEALN